MMYIYITFCIFIILYITKYFYRNNTISTIFYHKQYIGHARYNGPYKENSIQLYLYLIKTLHYKIIEGDVVFTSDGYPILNHGVNVDVYKEGKKYHININNIQFNQLMTYSTLPNKNAPFTTVEEFIKIGSQNNICIMIDLTFQKYTFKNLKTLYNLVAKYKMQNNIIWGDANVYMLFLIDRNLICQVGGSWGRRLLIEASFKSLFCKQIIMSYNYYGGSVSNLRKIVHYGHLLGLIMKVATINEQSVAEQFWEIGTDLINTDCLINKNYIR